MITKKDKIVKNADEQGWRLLKVMAELEGLSIGDMIAKMAKSYAVKCGYKELIKEIERQEQS